MIARMVVGYGIITFRLHDCRSLKEKRSVVKSVIHQIQNRFNVSIAEVGANDIHQTAEIGFALVGNSGPMVNSKMDKILNFAHDMPAAQVINSEMEMMRL
jgi:uncharacterized protein YlxP (DUF503 family)